MATHCHSTSHFSSLPNLGDSSVGLRVLLTISALQNQLSRGDQWEAEPVGAKTGKTTTEKVEGLDGILALKMEPGDVVEFASLLDTSESLTLEMWVRSPAPNANLYLIGFRRGCFLGAGSVRQICFKGAGGSTPDTYELGRQPNSWPANTRMHIAIVRDFEAKQHRLYVNGKLTDQVDRILEPVGSPLMICGTERQYASQKGHGFLGEIDEVRISSNARYNGVKLSPQRIFKPDEYTLGLYHCDEGQGDRLEDSSATTITV